MFIHAALLICHCNVITFLFYKLFYDHFLCYIVVSSAISFILDIFLTVGVSSLPDDLNTTHQHCVLAGETARFSSTHRVAEVRSQNVPKVAGIQTGHLTLMGWLSNTNPSVAKPHFTYTLHYYLKEFEGVCKVDPCVTLSLLYYHQCSRGTLTYIQSRCQEALSNLRTDPETGSHSLLALLPTTLQHCEEIHNEVWSHELTHTQVCLQSCSCDLCLCSTYSNDVQYFTWFCVYKRNQQETTEK